MVRLSGENRRNLVGLDAFCTLDGVIDKIRWRKSAEDEWSCALHGRILSLRQDSEHLFYRSYHPTPSDVTKDDSEALIRHYFNLDVNLSELYEQWAKADRNFREKAPRFTGVRILRQDAWEALAGFICSSNNNISRISKMVCMPPA